MKALGIFILSLLAIFFLSCSREAAGVQTYHSLDFKVEDQGDFILPDDWKITLWAESPQLYNPTNIDIDAKGRLWVTEAVNYRDFNNQPEEYLHFNKGDRVVILEDTDGDGICDSTKVFVQDEDLVAPLGIAVIGNEVWVSCSPKLIKYTDENGDDIPDKKEVILEGFGGFDHDHSLHAITGGPDGLLYFNTGNAGPHTVKGSDGWTLRSGSVYTGGTPYNLSNSGGRVSDDGKIWVGGLALSMHYDASKLKVRAHNFRNAYELALDSYGNMWQNDNDDQVVSCRLSWVMEGGNAGYFSEDGSRSWQSDQRPGQSIFTAHWHQEDPGVMPAGDLTGAGSPTGIVIYESDAFGSKYDQMVLSAEAGRNVIFAYRPNWFQAGPRLERKDILTSVKGNTENYKWNELFDDKRRWFRPSDIAVGTDGSIYIADWYDSVVGGHQMNDSLGYGRIFRITPKDKQLSPPSLDMESTEGQLEALLNPAVNVRYAAFQQLKNNDQLSISQVLEIFKRAKPYEKARLIWLLSNMGEEGSKQIVSMIARMEDPLLILTSIKALAFHQSPAPALIRKLFNDAHPMIKRELFNQIDQWDSSDLIPLILTTIDGQEESDPWLTESIGSCIESHAIEGMFFEHLMNEYGLDLSQWPDPAFDLLWRIHPEISIPYWEELANTDRQRSKKAIDAIAFVSGEQAVDAMIRLYKNTEGEEKAYIEWWLNNRMTNDWKAYEEKISASLPEDYLEPALKLLQLYVMDEHLTENERLAAIQELASKENGAELLLNLAGSKKLPATAKKKIEQLLTTHKDEHIRNLAVSLFPSSHQQISVSYQLEAISKLNGDVHTGKTLFQKNCQVCHQSNGEAQALGPDLGKIAQKFGPKELLEAIIDPSETIAFGYEPVSVLFEDGTEFSGRLIANGDPMMIQDLSGYQRAIPKREIKQLIRSSTSLMPPAAAMQLDEQALANIVAYLFNQPNNE